MEPAGFKGNPSSTLPDSMSTPSSLPSLTDDDEDDRLDSIHYPPTFQQDTSGTGGPSIDVNKSLPMRGETTSDFEDTVNKSKYQTNVPEETSRIEEELVSHEDIKEKTDDQSKHMTSSGNATIEHPTWLAESGQLLSPQDNDVGKSENFQEPASCQTGMTVMESENLVGGDKTQQELVSKSICQLPDLSAKEPVREDVVCQSEVQEKLDKSNLEGNELTSQEEGKEELELQSERLKPKQSSVSYFQGESNSNPTVADSMATPSSLPTLTDDENKCLEPIHYPETFQPDISKTSDPSIYVNRVNKSLQRQGETISDLGDTESKVHEHQTDVPEESSRIEGELVSQEEITENMDVESKHMTSTENSTIEHPTLLAESGQLPFPHISDGGRSENCEEPASCQTGTSTPCPTETDSTEVTCSSFTFTQSSESLTETDQFVKRDSSDNEVKKDLVYQPEVHELHQSNHQEKELVSQEDRKEEADLQSERFMPKQSSKSKDLTLPMKKEPSQTAFHTTSTRKEPENRQDFASTTTDNHQSPSHAATSNKSLINPFRRMVRQVGKFLSISDVDEMVYLTEQSQELLKETEYRERPFYYLMTTLEKQGKVTESNLDLLVECLEELQCKKAIQSVETYKMSIASGQVESTDPQQETKRDKDHQHSKQDVHQQGHNSQTPGTPSLRPSDRKSEMLNSQRKTMVCSWQDARPMLQDFGIVKASGHAFSITDCMTLNQTHLYPGNERGQSVVMTFLSRIMSFDHRAIKVFKDLDCNSDISRGKQTHLSCRDVIFAFLNKCDPFLRQEILSKMAACQLAVPVLLPNVKQTSVSLLVWGLQRIKKVWFDRRSAKVQEQVVIKFPFPVVSFLRFGHTGWSKSNILNKMLGSIQGNDDHPYFTSNEQDRRPSVLSHGSLEAVWYHSRADDDRKYSLTEALCFLNLRGDANEFPVQRHFIQKYSLVAIVFVRQADLHQLESKIDLLSEESHVIVVVNNVNSCFANEERSKKSGVSCKSNVIVLNLSGYSTLEISERLCAEIKHILSLPDRRASLPLEASVAYCDSPGLTIHADILEKECREAKNVVEDILRFTSKGSKQYKQDALPLQLIWLKWSQLDKDRTWKGTQSNTERQIARLHKEKQDQRRRQRHVGVSVEMKTLYEALSRSTGSFKQFLVFWLQHYLNELSFDTLRPLINNLKEVSYKARETASEITRLKRRISSSSTQNKQKNAIEDKIKEMTARETKLQQELSKLTREFDACSLGFEHFVREFGQIYECFHNNHLPSDADPPVCPFNVNSLPRLAAELLLSGQPLEIFDGDACHVPIKWVTGVLKAVRSATNNSKIYVISVIGIQSSGKSTLLNSMFGVRFAVSAGRCTRGVFLQLLPLTDVLKRRLRCDFIAVIDTEGLKAPEKALSNHRNEDNELATFALCISDMTLINIGGQTVGEDLSNILQISAHAFIRMKEVHLRSSCYLIQQFVADITAQYRNHSSTQSILQKLDQAVVTAAIEERKQDQYRQFSDCFNIVNIGNDNDRVQYMPSLWRASMSAPNHEYSEIVLKLKSELLQEIEGNGQTQTVDEFTNRIVSVWKAVKQEDFVFNFRNTNEIAQYNNFSRWYQKKLLKLTQGMMKWELDAKTKIKNTAAENIRDCQEILFQQLKETIDLELEKNQSAMDETLQNGEHESVKNHANYFFRDLNNQGHQIHETVRKALNLEASVIINAKTKDNEFLPAIKAKLRRQVFPLAESLQLTLPQNDDPSTNPEISSEIETLVKEAFEEEWTKQMRDVQLQRPTRSSEEIQTSIESDIEECIVDCLKNTDLSKEMKQLLENYKLRGLCQTSPLVRCIEDIQNASQQTRSCSKPLTEHLNNLNKLVMDMVTQKGFCFSRKFTQELRKALIPIISNKCPGCKRNTEIILCVSCQVLQRANEATEQTVLAKVMKSKKLMEKLELHGIPTQWNIQRDVNLRLKNVEPTIAGGVINKMKTWVGEMLWNNEAEMEDNFANHVQGQFFDRIGRINKKRWYSVQEASAFIKMTLQFLKDFNVPKRKHQQLLAEACSFFIHEAIESEASFARENLSWKRAQVIMNMEALSILDQRDIFVDTLRDVLPNTVINGLKGMSNETIRKYARIPLNEDLRHAIDQSLISLIPLLDTTKYETILSVTQESRSIFLGLIQESAVYSTSVGRALVTSTLEEINNNTDLGKLEQAVTIAYVCSWALPICIDMTITFERNNSIQALLEEEKELLYSDFKSLCNGACEDQLAAKSLCAIIQVSLQEALKNRLCGSLFERLCTAGNDIFCSRPRFLQTVLEQLCKEEIFESYAAFLRNHHSYIKTWTLQFMATECCHMATDHIRIKDVAMHEINQLLHETEESFNTALRSVQEDEDEDDLFEEWVNTFIDTLEKNITCTLNEENIAQLYSYHKITDFTLFTKECIKIIKTFQDNILVDSLQLPDMSSTDSIAAWFQNHLPKQLHVLLANSVRGCGSQCPFCKTFCDDTVKEHKVHFSNLHYPTGVGGVRNRRTRNLGSSTCVANVATDGRGYYKCGCGHDSVCNHPRNLYKNYKKDYPDWDIHPVSDYEPTIYWKWVLTRFNQEFANYYRCKPANIPWGTVTKDEALASLRQIYSVEVPDD